MIKPRLHLITLGGERERTFRDEARRMVLDCPEIVVLASYDGKDLGRRKVDVQTTHELSLEGAEPTDGELGCLLAHMHVWRAMEREALADDEWWIVVEDDMKLPRDFVALVEAARRAVATQGVDLLFLYHEQHIFRARRHPPDGLRVALPEFGHELYEPAPMFGGGAYMLTPRTARAFLDNMRLGGAVPRFFNVDEITWATYYREAPDEYAEKLPHTYGDAEGQFLLYPNLVALLNDPDRARVRALNFRRPPCKSRSTTSLTAVPSWLNVENCGHNLRGKSVVMVNT